MDSCLASSANSLAVFDKNYSFAVIRETITMTSWLWPYKIAPVQQLGPTGQAVFEPIYTHRTFNGKLYKYIIETGIYDRNIYF